MKGPFSQTIHRSRASIENLGFTLLKFTDTVIGMIFIAVVAIGVVAFTLVRTDLFEDSPAGRDSDLVSIAPLTIPRADHTTVLLEDGRVLVQGGGDGETISYISAEIYDPASRTWSKATNLGTARRDHRSIVLNDGRVLITGGVDHFGVTFTAESYNTATGEVQPERGMRALRAIHSMSLLPDGRVLVTGGMTPRAPSGFTDIFDPVGGRFEPGPI